MALTTATIIALGGAAVGGATNLVAAGKARDQQRKADKAAGRLLADARAKIEKDFYEGLKLPTDAYDQAYEANAQSQRESVEALQQADARSLAAGVGRVGALSNENTQKIRAQQSQEMFALDKLKAEGKDNMNQQLIQMDVAAAQDKAARAAQADEKVGMLQAGAAQALIGGVTAAAEAQALNPVSKADRELSKSYDKNKSIFTKNNISRSEYLKDPSKYANLLKPATIDPPNTSAASNTNTNLLNYTPNLSFPTQDSALTLNTQDMFNFQPNLNYGFSFQDRMQSFLNRPQVDLSASLSPLSLNKYRS